ncbi:MAG: hypothetical protein ACK56I_05075, partial [bacterium]
GITRPDHNSGGASTSASRGRGEFGQDVWTSRGHARRSQWSDACMRLRATVDFCSRISGLSLQLHAGLGYEPCCL